MNPSTNYAYGALSATILGAGRALKSAQQSATQTLGKSAATAGGMITSYIVGFAQSAVASEQENNGVFEESSSTQDLLFNEKKPLTNENKQYCSSLASGSLSSNACLAAASSFDGPTKKCEYQHTYGLQLSLTNSSFTKTFEGPLQFCINLIPNKNVDATALTYFVDKFITNSKSFVVELGTLALPYIVQDLIQNPGSSTQLPRTNTIHSICTPPESGFQFSLGFDASIPRDAIQFIWQAANTTDIYLSNCSSNGNSSIPTAGGGFPEVTLSQGNQAYLWTLPFFVAGSIGLFIRSRCYLKYGNNIPKDNPLEPSTVKESILVLLKNQQNIQQRGARSSNDSSAWS